MGNNYVLAVGIALGSQILSVALGQDLTTTAFPSGISTSTVNWWNNQDISSTTPLTSTTAPGGVGGGASVTTPPPIQSASTAYDPSATTTLSTALGMSTAGVPGPPATTLAPDTTTKAATWHSMSAILVFTSLLMLLN